MKYRSTIVYLVAAIILVGFYIYETRTEKKEGEAREEAKQIFQIGANRLDSITLIRDKQIIKLEKSGVTDQQKWEITAPIRTETEKFLVGRIADKLAKLKSSRVISENAEDLTQFGLNKPVFTISYTSDKGDGSLSFGFRSPIEDGFYAGEGKKVYLIATSDKELLDKTLFDLRDKRLFTIDTDRVNRMIIDRESEKWTLFKKEGRWFFEGDEGLKIDRDRIESAIRRIIWEEASSFEKEMAYDLKTCCLDSPKARIILSDGKKSEEIILGGRVKDDKKDEIYAKMRGRPQIVTVRSRFLEDLPKTKDEIKENECKP